MATFLNASPGRPRAGGQHCWHVWMGTWDSAHGAEQGLGLGQAGCQQGEVAGSTAALFEGVKHHSELGQEALGD